MTLSFFYHKQSQRMEKIYRKRARAFGEYEVRTLLKRIKVCAHSP